MNDNDKFLKFFKCIYRGELELKLEQIGIHATFLDQGTKFENGIFVYKLFEKREKFKFLIVGIPHFERNVEPTTFYELVFSEFLRIARCKLKLEHFLPSGSELYSRGKSKLRQ